jgi:hypothetical protein
MNPSKKSFIKCKIFNASSEGYVFGDLTIVLENI